MDYAEFLQDDSDSDVVLPKASTKPSSREVNKKSSNGKVLKTNDGGDVKE